MSRAKAARLRISAPPHGEPALTFPCPCKNNRQNGLTRRSPVVQQIDYICNQI
jgi:hypothetical protein